MIEDHLGELAFHFGEAATGDASGNAVDYACRAGERAQRLLAYEDSAELAATLSPLLAG